MPDQPSPESTAQEAPSRRPWFTTMVGGVLIMGLLVMPWLPIAEGDELSDSIRFAGHFHPLILHLPIGVFALVFLQEFLRMLLFRKDQEKGLGYPLSFGVLSALLAVVLGFLLWKSGAEDYAGNDLAERHLWGGIAFAVVAVIACLLKLWSQALGWRPWSYRLPLFASVGVMGFASHDGASMTHGSDYLTQHAPAPVRELLGMEPKKSEQVVSEDPLVYMEVIEPIFERRCVQCHKEGKSKGRLRLDSFEMLVKGGNEGSGIEAGDAESSNIVVRMMLPMDDEEHMPPEGKPQVEADELAVIKWWINGGARESSRLSEVEVSTEVQGIIAGLLDIPSEEVQGGGPIAGHGGAVKPSPDVQELVDSLSQQFPGTVSFESQQSPYVTLSAVSMRGKMGDAEFKAFAKLIPHLASADLSATSITDASASMLVDAKKLKSLRLSETGITDAALDALLGLDQLESLNLFGTAVTDAGVAKLAALPNLKRLYLWQTKVSDEGVEKLRGQLPECEIVLGVETTSAE